MSGALLSADRLMHIASYGVYVFALALTVRRILQRWQQVAMASSSYAKLAEARSREIRRLGKRTYVLRRELRLAEKMVADAVAELQEMEASVAERRDARRAVFMLDELCRPGDKLFEAEVRHVARAVPEPFKDNERTYLVWAADERRAHSRLTMHFRNDVGYSVGPVRPRDAMPPPL